MTVEKIGFKLRVKERGSYNINEESYLYTVLNYTPALWCRWTEATEGEIAVFSSGGDAVSQYVPHFGDPRCFVGKMGCDIRPPPPVNATPPPVGGGDGGPRGGEWGDVVLSTGTSWPSRAADTVARGPTTGPLYGPWHTRLSRLASSENARSFDWLLSFDGAPQTNLVIQLI